MGTVKPIEGDGAKLPANQPISQSANQPISQSANQQAHATRLTVASTVVGST